MHVVDMQIDCNGFLVPHDAFLFKDIPDFGKMKEKYEYLCKINGIDDFENQYAIELVLNTEECKDIQLDGFKIPNIFSSKEGALIRINKNEIPLWYPAVLFEDVKEGGIVNIRVPIKRKPSQLRLPTAVAEAMPDKIELRLLMKVKCRQSGSAYTKFGNFKGTYKKIMQCAESK